MAGKCFLCLQKTKFNSETVTGADNGWIHHIFQYFGVSSKRLVSTEIKKSGKDIFDIKLCSSCITLTTKLSSLIRQLEVTQMWIDYQVKECQKIFLESDNQALEECTTNPDLQQLRSKLKSKCYLEAKRLVNPTVKLERIEVQSTVKVEAPDDLESSEDFYDNTETFHQERTEGSLVTPSVESDSQSDSETEDSFGSPHTSLDQPEALDEGQSESDNEKAVPEATIPMSNLINLLSQPVGKIMTKDSSPGISGHCLLCEKPVKARANRTTFNHLVATHVALYHTHELFMKVKHKNLDTEKFATYCRHALNSELYRNGPLSRGARFQCPHCPYNCDSTTQQTIRLHIIRSHYSYLEQKIIYLQKTLESKSPEDIEAYLKGSKFDTWARFCQNSKKQYFTNFQCVLCKRKNKESGFTGHLLRHHPETLFTSDTSTTWDTSDKEKFHKLCEYVLHSKIRRAKRVQQNGPHKYGYECHLCKVKTQSFHFHIEHLAKKHFENLKGNLQKLEKDKNLDVSSLQVLMKRTKTYHICGDTPAKVLYRVCHQFYTELEDGSGLRCSLCKKAISLRSKRYHFLTNHMETVFEEMKLENVTVHQFIACCRETMERELAVAKISKVNDGIGYECRYCKELVRRCFMKDVQSHLILQHFEILEKTLVRLQRERIWEKEGRLAKDGEKDKFEGKRKRGDLAEGRGPNKKRIKIQVVVVEREKNEQVGKESNGSVVTGEGGNDRELIETDGTGNSPNFSGDAESQKKSDVSGID